MAPSALTEDDSEELCSPPEPRFHPHQSRRIRLQLLLAAWTVILCLGLPTWWMTTTIERRSLPSGRIKAWTARYVKAQERLSIKTILQIKLGDDARAIWDQGELQNLVQDRLINLPLKDDGFVIAPELYSGAEDLADVPGCYMLNVQLILPGEESLIAIKGRTLTFYVDTHTSSTALVESMVSAFRAVTTGLTDKDRGNQVKMSSRYSLMFSLMYENVAETHLLANSANAWTDQFETLVRRDLRPVFDQYTASGLHEFDYTTQQAAFAPLRLATTGVEGPPRYRTIHVDDLNRFVITGLWALGSSAADESSNGTHNEGQSDLSAETIHFVLWIPSEEKGVLKVLNASENEVEGAFVVPRWGGIVIGTHSPIEEQLNDAFPIFASQLRHLLGQTSLPISDPLADAYTESYLAVDAVIRSRVEDMMMLAGNTLNSLADLVNTDENLRVSGPVQKDVQRSMEELELASQALQSSSHSKDAFRSSLVEGLQHSTIAAGLASRAFFDPSMLGLLYFPDEHKYAIYTPLFGPISVPLIAGLIRELKSWLRGRRRRVQASSATNGKEKME